MRLESLLQNPCEKVTSNFIGLIEGEVNDEQKSQGILFQIGIFDADEFANLGLGVIVKFFYIPSFLCCVPLIRGTKNGSFWVSIVFENIIEGKRKTADHRADLAIGSKSRIS